MGQDGNQSFLMGQNASKDPDLIDPAQYASGINVNIQQGFLSPRWGYVRAPLTFPSGTLLTPRNTYRTYEDIFRSGRFQAMIPYVVGNTFYQIFVISGVIFMMNQKTYEMSVIPISDGSFLNYGAPRINWANAGKYVVIFDYPARPVILEEFTARRSVSTNFEVPISVLGTYNQNRLFIANAGNEYTGGDPSGSLATPDAPITFEEVLLSGSPYFGQIFKLPTAYNNGQITAMTFLQSADSSTGIGPMLIGTEQEVWAAGTNNPRSTWDNSQFASNLVFNAGISGPRAVVQANSDCFFMSPDAEIRPLSMSRQEQQRWSKVPISREVQNWLTINDKNLAKYASLGYFKNKIFATVNPLRVPAVDLVGNNIIDVCHVGMVVLELDSISTLSGEYPPAWAGIWTGIRPMDMNQNNSRMFVIAKDDSTVNHVYEVDPSINHDVIDGKVRRVRSRVYTREYNFGNAYLQKEINNIVFNIEDVKGEFELNVQFKPSHAEKYLEWRTFSHRAPWRSCEMPRGCEYHGLAGHNFRELYLGSPIAGDACNEVTKDNYSLFKKLQLKLDITGINWKIKDFVLLATDKPQNMTALNCESYPEVKVCSQCSDDLILEEDDSCQAQTL